MCCELEWSIQNHDTGRVYKNIHELCKHLSKVTMKSVEDITAEQARNHFLKIGGEPALQFEQEMLEHVQQREVREDLGKVPDDAEILEAMKQMKESAAGLDEVSIGMLTSGGANTMRKVCAIVKKLWVQAGAGEMWEEQTHAAIVMMLYKGKGDRADPDKYRGICLLTIISRITAKVAVRRIAGYAEQEKLLNNAQWGFRPGRSTRDAIITLRMMAEMCADHEERCRQKIEAMEKQGGAQEEIEEMKKTMEDNRGMVQLIDIQKAYPNFSRELAWQVLRKHGLPENLVRVVSTLHEDTVYEVKMTNTKSEKYKLRRGFREGCPSSCTRYNLVHNVAVEALQEKLEGIKFMHTSRFALHNGKHNDEAELEEMLIKILAFADDTTAVGNLKDKEMIDQCIQRVFADHAEKVHPGKSEWMAMGMKQDTSTLGDGLSKHV